MSVQIRMGYQDPLLLSPPIDVEWCGFRSTTRAMQAAGWEFAVDASPQFRSRTILARHRDLGVMMTAELFDDDVRSRALVYNKNSGYSGYQGPPVRFNGLNHESRVTFVSVDPTQMIRVDMNPEYTTIEEHRWNGDAIDLFRKWAPQSEEIIVEPETVADLFERIKKMQSPELADIRERNRRRDLRDQQRESVVAQIITLA